MCSVVLSPRHSSRIRGADLFRSVQVDYSSAGHVAVVRSLVDSRVGMRTSRFYTRKNVGDTRRVPSGRPPTHQRWSLLTCARRRHAIMILAIGCLTPLRHRRQCFEPHRPHTNIKCRAYFSAFLSASDFIRHLSFVCTGTETASSGRFTPFRSAYRPCVTTALPVRRAMGTLSHTEGLMMAAARCSDL